MIWVIAVGIPGSFLGGWLVRLAGIALAHVFVEVLLTLVGAAILLVALRALIAGAIPHARGVSPAVLTYPCARLRSCSLEAFAQAVRGVLTYGDAGPARTMLRCPGD